jgi:hypothetical protein
VEPQGVRTLAFLRVYFSISSNGEKTGLFFKEMII